MKALSSLSKKKKTSSNQNTHSVLGDAGIHSRSAVGTNALPLNVAVEIEAIVEV